MGMFDRIYCDYPLPGGYSAPDYQTKSLNCGLDDYKITKDGELLIKTWDWEHTSKWYRVNSTFGHKEYVPCPEVPYSSEDIDWAWHIFYNPDSSLEDKALSTDILDSPMREYRKINLGWKHYDFTGEINFYDYDDMIDKLYEFFAKFENGHLVDIRKGA